MDLKFIDPETLHGNCCFNGSIFVKDCVTGQYSFHYKSDQDKVYCVYRSTPSRAQCFHSSTHITTLNIKEASADPDYNIRLFYDIPKEDPRVFCAGNKLMITYSHVLNHLSYRHRSIRIKGRIFESLELPTNVSKNTDSEIDFNLNDKQRMQKNWTFFQLNGINHILYNIMPLEVSLWDASEDLSMHTSICVPIAKRDWQHPFKTNLKLRGSCPVVEVDGELYVFVHSTDYEVYCIVLDRDFFNVVRVTRDPVIPNRGNKQDIHFPCGAIFDVRRQVFVLSLGVDDIKLALFEIEKRTLDDMMVNVEKDDSLIIQYIDQSWTKVGEQCNFILCSTGGCGNDKLVDLLEYSPQVLDWDAMLCHCIKPPQAINVPIIYICRDVIITISSMIHCGNHKTNFAKLSNQLIGNELYSLTGLMYYIMKSIINWRRWSERSSNAKCLFLVNNDDVMFLQQTYLFLEIDYRELHAYDKYTNTNTRHVSKLLLSEPQTLQKCILKNVYLIINNNACL